MSTDSLIELWLKFEYWYDTEAALILIGKDPLQLTSGARPSKKMVREQFPDAAVLLQIFERSSLVQQHGAKQHHLNFLRAAERASILKDKQLRDYMSKKVESGQGEAPAGAPTGVGHLTEITKPAEITDTLPQFNGIATSSEPGLKLASLLLYSFLEVKKSKMLGEFHNANISQIAEHLAKRARELSFDIKGLGKSSMQKKVKELLVTFKENKFK
jgi:hypothetical protein